MTQDIYQREFLTRKEFYDKYWFTPLQMITVINPRIEDYKFMVEMRHFMIRAGATESIPGQVANVYLSQMTRILAQDDEKMEHLSDYNLMKKYFDKLIVDIESLVPEDKSEPEYLKDVPLTVRNNPTSEVPPWEEKDVVLNHEKSNEEVEREIKKKAEKEIKEFEYNNSKYRVVRSKTGRAMYYKNGTLTSEAEYSKAASML